MKNRKQQVRRFRLGVGVALIDDPAAMQHHDGVRISASQPVAAALVRATADAFFNFYRENPRDLDLGFYLFQGMQPRGLTPPLNEGLNKRLRDSLRPTQESLESLGMPQEEAESEITALFAYIVGLLVLSHTGRIRMFKQASPGLFNVYMERLVLRAKAYSSS